MEEEYEYANELVKQKYYYSPCLRGLEHISGGIVLNIPNERDSSVPVVFYVRASSS